MAAGVWQVVGWGGVSGSLWGSGLWLCFYSWASLLASYSISEDEPHIMILPPPFFPVGMLFFGVPELNRTFGLRQRSLTFD